MFELNKIYCGNAIENLRTFPEKSVQCCITSPPYYGLRSYLPQDHPDKQFEIGNEVSPEEYVNKLVEIFREVRRVLSDSGILFLNLGDTYWGSWGNSGHRPELDGTPSHQRGKETSYLPRGGWDQRRERPPTSYGHPRLKPKDLVGIPWTTALALRDDGWWLRSDNIWAKGVSGQKELTTQIVSAAHEIGIEDNKVEELLLKLDLYVGNPMPESIKDRCTRSHEYVFMFAKSEKYYYDSEAVAEDLKRPNEAKRKTPGKFGGADKFEEASKQSRLHSGNEYKGTKNGKRNRRDVWTISTKSFKGAHFATFNEELINPCILAGSRPGDVILDPFIGSGTTAVAAKKLGRNFVGIDLNPEYMKMAMERINGVT